MVKRNLARKILMSVLTGAVLMSSNVVWADTPNGWQQINFSTYIPLNGTGVINEDGIFEGAFVGKVGPGDITGGEVIVEKGNFKGKHVSYAEVSEDASGMIYGAEANTGSAFENEVLINGGVFEKYNDCECIISGGVSKNKEARGNIVNVTAGIFNDKTRISGGESESYVVNNCVNILGGTFDKANICGGYTFNNGKAEGNVVNIVGGYLSNSSLYGGANDNNYTPVYGGKRNPNTLNLGTSQEMWRGKVASIKGFDVINFERIDWEKDSTVVETDSLDVQDTQIKVNTVFVAAGTTLSNGDKMTLIQADAMTGDIEGTKNGNIVTGSERAVIYQGVAEAVTVNAEVKQDENAKKIYLELTGIPEDGKVDVTKDSTVSPSGGVPSGSSRNDQVLVIGESRAAATAFTNQGSELIETGLDTLARDKSEADTKVFASVYGNTSEYATGSNVKVNGWSGIVGVGKTNANGLTMGAFFENGEGNFRTYNDVNGMFMRGDGEACYNGGGFFVRKDNANGVYTEASLRAGNLQNELRNAVIGSEGLTGYDVDTFYYGAHVGVGKIIPRGNDGDSLDVYGKFIYTHHDSEDFTIDGSDFHFDSIDSERLRLGFRLNEVQNDRLTMYYGAAWEYEFNGDSLDKAASFDLETPTLDGSTVIGEVGVHYKASEKWSLDLNARAYGGQREGFSGSLQANYNF